MANKGMIFVTGGAGFIGNYVVKELLRQDYGVRVLLRQTTDTRRIDGLKYEKWPGDILDVDSLNSGMKDCTGVIHLAGFSNWKDIKSPRMSQVVIDGSMNVIESARMNGGIKTVYVSSSTAINGTDEMKICSEDSIFTIPAGSQFKYALAKKTVEDHCRSCAQNGHPIIIVNPSEVYGPLDYSRITCGNLIDFATAKTVQVAKGGTSIVHAEDVAAGIVAAMEKGRSGERYILGSDNLEIEQLARMTLEILGLNKRIKYVPRSLLLKMAWMSKTFGINMGFEPEVIPYAVKYWFSDNSKAKQELGIQFRPAREILEPTLKWVRDEGMIK